MDSMKRPAFQFYPGDWLEEGGLRASCLAARGLWVDMLCYMHGGQPYGHLNYTAAQLSRMVGESLRKVTALLAELEQNGVFSRTPTGTIFSRRQVRDEANREKRAAGGPESLKNPNVPRPKDTQKDGPKDTLPGSLGGSPSSPSPSPSPSPTSTPENERSFSTGTEGGNGHGPLTDEQYADAVWSKHIERSGLAATRIMSPAEFTVLRGWMDAEIPLRIVLRGIEDTAGKGHSLAYYSASVRDAADYWRKALA